MRNAALLFVSMATAAGVNITLMVQDDNSTVAGAAAATTALLARGVDVFLGPFTADLTAAVRNLTEAAGTPTLLVAPASIITSMFVGTASAFGVLLPAAKYLSLPLGTMHAAGARTILMVTEPRIGLQSMCSIDPAGYGLLVVGPTVTVTAATIDDVLDVIVALGPDVVGLCVLFAIAQQLLNRAAVRGVNPGGWVTVFGLTDARVASDPVLATSYLAEGVSWSAVSVIPGAPLAVDSTCAAYAPYGCVTPLAFSTAFTAAFGSPPSETAAATFSGLDVLVQSMAAAGGSVNPAVLIPQVASQRFSTAFGVLQFGVHSHQNVGSGFSRQLQGTGVVQVVAPFAVATSTIVFPAPTWAQQACARGGGCGAHGVCAPSGGCSCSLGYSGGTCGAPVGLAFIIIACVCVLAATVATLGWALRSRWRAVMASKLAVAQCDAVAELAAATSAADTRRKILRYAFHELRVPFNSVVLGLHELRAGAEARHDAGALADILLMQAAADGMQRLLTDTLIAEKMDSGAYVIELRPAHLVGVAQAVVASMLPWARDDGVALSLSLGGADGGSGGGAPVPAWVLADPNRISQVLANFVSNALKFVDHGGTGVVVVRVLAIGGVNEAPAAVAAAAASPHLSAQGTTAVMAAHNGPNNYRAVSLSEASVVNVPLMATRDPSSSPSVSSTSASTSASSFTTASTTAFGPVVPAFSLVQQKPGQQQLTPTPSHEALSSPPPLPPPPFQWMRFEVADNGVGISEEGAANLWQPFQQIQAGVLQEGRGTGLGLSICREIVARHGGRTGMTSTVGVGTTFYAEIPFTVCADPAIQRKLDEKTVELPRTPRRQQQPVELADDSDELVAPAPLADATHGSDAAAPASTFSSSGRLAAPLVVLLVDDGEVESSMSCWFGRFNMVYPLS